MTSTICSAYYRIKGFSSLYMVFDQTALSEFILVTLRG